MLLAEDAGDLLGAVYSTDVATLRTFASAYMDDRRTIGSLTLYDPGGRPAEEFDLRTGDWKDVGETMRLA